MPYRQTVKGLEVALRVTPKASVNRVQGIMEQSDGSKRLKIQVTSVPENGKANEAVIKVLSKAWKIPKTGMIITSGALDRNKTICITSNMDDIMSMLDTMS